MTDDLNGWDRFPCHRDEPAERDEWRSSLLALLDGVEAREHRSGTLLITGGAAFGGLLGVGIGAAQAMPAVAVLPVAVALGLACGMAVAGLLRVDREQSARLRAIVQMDQVVTGSGHDGPAAQAALTAMAQRTLADEHLCNRMSRRTARRLRARARDHR